MNTILEKDGKPIGRLFTAFTNAVDSRLPQITMLSSEAGKYLIESLTVGAKLRVASSNEECHVVSVSEDGVIKTDKPVSSMNKDYLMAGDILIIDKEELYE